MVFASFGKVARVRKPSSVFGAMVLVFLMVTGESKPVGKAVFGWLRNASPCQFSGGMSVRDTRQRARIPQSFIICWYLLVEVSAGGQTKVGLSK